MLTICEQWHRRGLVTRDEMQTDCCFATLDKTWVLDPDGNEWEVFVVLKDDLPEKAEAAPACSLPSSSVDQVANPQAASCRCGTN